MFWFLTNQTSSTSTEVGMSILRMPNSSSNCSVHTQLYWTEIIRNIKLLHTVYASIHFLTIWQCIARSINVLHGITFIQLYIWWWVSCILWKERIRLFNNNPNQVWHSQKRFCTWMTSPTSSMFQFIIRYIPDFQKTGWVVHLCASQPNKWLIINNRVAELCQKLMLCSL